VHLPEAIAVPADAVVDSGRRTLVYVARSGGVFEPRAVEIGWQSGDRVAITRGLEVGDRVVTGANFLLDSESRLRLAASQTTAVGKTDPVCGMVVKFGVHSIQSSGRT